VFQEKEPSDHGPSQCHCPQEERNHQPFGGAGAGIDQEAGWR
jgi:hypothetical protein